MPPFLVNAPILWCFTYFFWLKLVSYQLSGHSNILLYFLPCLFVFSMWTPMWYLTTVEILQRNGCMHYAYIAGDASNRTVIWFAVWWLAARATSWNTRCGCHNEHLRCNDEFFGLIRWAAIEGVLISKSCYRWISIMFDWFSINVTSQKYGAHFGHIQCHQR